MRARREGPTRSTMSVLIFCKCGQDLNWGLIQPSSRLDATRIGMRTSAPEMKTILWKDKTRALLWVVLKTFLGNVWCYFFLVGGVPVESWKFYQIELNLLIELNTRLSNLVVKRPTEKPVGLREDNSNVDIECEVVANPVSYGAEYVDHRVKDWKYSSENYISRKDYWPQ